MQRVKMMKKYADLIIRNGLNTQARQDVAIIANAEMHTFVGYFVAELYKMHVHSVRVFYRDPVATRFYLMNTPETKLSPIADYITSFYKEASEKNFSIILFEGTDPQVLRKNTREKHQAYRKAIENSCHSSFYKYKRGTLPFVRVAVPTRDWAVSIYPELTPVQGEDRLWQDVYERSGIWRERLSAESGYRERISRLFDISQKLNSLRLAKIIITDSNTKTNLTVSLPIKHIWYSPLKTSEEFNEKFLTEMPGFFISTVPHSHGVKGVVNSTKVVYFDGEPIEDVSLTFENGKIVKATASKGQEALNKAIAVDDYSNRLGGITLVDRDLMPEASSEEYFDNYVLNMTEGSHITIGCASYRGFEGGYDLTPNELQSHGLNQSLLSLDFPIMSDTLSVVGVGDDNSKHLIMDKGHWAI